MEQHRNTFDGGLDTNTSRSLIQPNKYVEANNVNIASDNNFFSLENIRGTTPISDIISRDNVSVLGVFSTNYKIDDDYDIPCLTIFTAQNIGTESIFKIWVHDVVNNVLYEPYESEFDGTDDYFTSDRVVSAFVYPENGIDILYFTDHYTELGKLNCTIDTAGTTLTRLDVKLLKNGAIGTVVPTDVVEGGSLFCGSYQIAYQMLNPSTGQTTKFSMFSEPIQVYLSADSFNLVRSGVGVQSSKKIILDIKPTPSEMSYYTHFRLAVIENIEPSGVVVTQARLTQIEPVSEYKSVDSVGVDPYITDYEYASNIRLETIDISEIVVDKAAIKTAKTIAVRDNRLIAGNIKYKDLSYDNGSPKIGGGSILKQSSGTYDNMFSVPSLSSKYRGYFRGEVYRFAISYFDEDGNFSYPQVLDLSSIEHNQITGAFKDMKFPLRSQRLGTSTYSLFKNGEGVQSLGLRLEAIDNHPTWAKGFVILRSKRIKNVLFQTPIIPMNQVYGLGTVENYPSVSVEAATLREVSRPNDTPMGPFTTYVPRNYFWANASDIREFSVSGGTTGGGKDRRFSGEAYLTSNPRYELGMIFPPEFMYENKPFVFSPNYRLRTVDAALLKKSVTDFSDIRMGTTTKGLNIKTSVSGTFYALLDGQYYYNSSNSGSKPSIGSSNAILNDYEEFDNYSGGSSLGGLNLFKYDKLQTGGTPLGQVSSVQKCGVVKLDQAKFEINYHSTLLFGAGIQLFKLITTHNQAYDMLSTGFRQTVEIVNVEAGLSDERYGKFDTPHEFISTGTAVFFTSEEQILISAGTPLPKTVDVWGGDCYVTPHLFKLTDTSYGVTNSTKFINPINGSTVIESSQNWERSYGDIEEGTNCVISIPAPYKNSSQYIQLILESEYNAGVIDAEIINTLGTDGITANKMPILGLNSSSEGSCRVPLTYKLNHNHRKENSDKIYRLKDPLINTNLEFGARLIYSDQKVYHTSIAGFDTMRVLNFKDLEEVYGDIHALALAGDNLYSLQEKAVTYIGIGERVLETTDALTLSIQSGSFIGNVILLDNNKGTQHLQSVLSTGNGIYFLDNRNQSINRISGRSVEVISDKTLSSTLRRSLNHKVGENDIQTIYDPIRKQIWFSKQADALSEGSFCYVFDEGLNMWVSNYQFPLLYNGTFADQKLFLIGDDNLNISVHSMYTGERTKLFDSYVTPNVVFISNPLLEASKRFDGINIASSNSLDYMNIATERGDSFISQSSNGTSLDVNTRGEGTYKVKILRDSNGARLRGTYAIIDLKWKDDADIPAKLSSVITSFTRSF